MPEWSQIQEFLSQSQWIYHTFIIVFLTLLLDMMWRKFIRYISVKVQDTKNQWDDALIEAARLPVSGLIWLFGLSAGVQFSPSIEVNSVENLLLQSREVISIALATWFLVKFIEGIEKRVINADENAFSKLDPTSLHAISKLLRVSVLITSVLIILETLGYSLKGVLAFGGIGGIAVGFAAKDLLANFFGGLMIFLDRPFALGDWIRSPDRSIEGTVEHIGWRLTRIRTFDRRPLYIPNNIFTNIAVENPSRMSNRRIYETIGLRYEDVENLPQIIEAVKDYLKNHDEIDQRQTLMVNFNTYGHSALEFFIYAFTKTTKWIDFHNIKEAILLDIHEIIQKNNASIAYPTQRLLVESKNKSQSTLF